MVAADAEWGGPPPEGVRVELPESAAFLTQQARRGCFSGAVLVRQGGAALLDRSYGVADRATGRLNAPATAFQIASVSKQVAAAAILLRETGRELRGDGNLATIWLWQ
jgi:CubicO group peptidase (beta-lactamase class C family)